MHTKQNGFSRNRPRYCQTNDVFAYHETLFEATKFDDENIGHDFFDPVIVLSRRSEVAEVKREVTKPVRRRKKYFGPFESSYEEEEPQTIFKIPLNYCQPILSDNPWEHFQIRDSTIPFISLRKPLNKGDILEVKVLSIMDPGSFYIRIVGPKQILLPCNQNSKLLTKFTGKISSFYDRFQDEDVLEVGEDLEKGMIVVYKYTSKKTGNTEWRRGMVLGRLENATWKSYNYDVELFDYGIVVSVHYKRLRKLLKIFGEMPRQSIESRLAGVEPFLYSQSWHLHAMTYFKKKVEKSMEKKSMLCMIAEVPVSEKLDLFMVDHHRVKRKPKKCAVNFGLIRRNLASWDSKEKECQDVWNFYVDNLHQEIEEFQAKKEVSNDVLTTLESVVQKLRAN